MGAPDAGVGGEVDALLAAGRLDRAIRRMEQAEAQTPGAYALDARLVASLAEVGRFAELLRVADRIDRSADSSPEARTASAAARARAATDGGAESADALLNAARAARGGGHAAEAQRLFDRALAAAERESGTTASVSTPRAFAPERPVGSLDPACAWSPSGAMIAVSEGDAIWVLDAISLAEKWVFREPSAVAKLRFSRDERSLTALTEAAGHQWNLDGGVRRTLAAGSAPLGDCDPTLHVTRDGTRLVGWCKSIHDGGAWLTDLSAWVSIKPREPAAAEGEEFAFNRIATSFAVAPDERTFATGAGTRGVAVWSTSSGERLAVVAPEIDDAKAILFADDHTLVTFAERTLTFWNTKTGASDGTMVLDTDNDPVVSASGRYVAAAAPREAHVTLVDTAARTSRTLDGLGDVWPHELTADGAFLVATPVAGPEWSSSLVSLWGPHFATTSATSVRRWAITDGAPRTIMAKGTPPYSFDLARGTSVPIGAPRVLGVGPDGHTALATGGDCARCLVDLRKLGTRLVASRT